MPDIKDSVGEGGQNRSHDVALVQAMLRVVKNSKGHPYLPGVYDGSYGNITKNAIIAFQKDHNLAAAMVPAPAIKSGIPAGAPTGSKVGPAGLPGAGAIAGAIAGAAALAVLKEKLGFVKAGGATIQKLSAMLPADSKDIRIIEGTKTVYWPGSQANADAHAKNIANDPELEPGFRANVAKLVRTMFDRHKIVLSLTNSGGRRTFEQQYKLITQPDPPTGAGPGESNHNFGQAVDIGYKGWKWMRGDGRPEVDTWWLNDLGKAHPAKAQEMWDARNKIAFDELGMFKSNRKGDLIHMQKFSDDNVDMRRSLADLLTRVGTMQWQAVKGGYKCDLGTAGKSFFAVGTATQVWAGTATVSAAEVAAAKGVPVGQVKGADITAMRAKLKADFEAAETNWAKWVAK